MKKQNLAPYMVLLFAGLIFIASLATVCIRPLGTAIGFIFVLAFMIWRYKTIKKVQKIDYVGVGILLLVTLVSMYPYTTLCSA